MTMRRISSPSMAARRTSTQLYRRSQGGGIRNLSGADVISASRNIFGKANPITVSSRENARKTIRPTRNFTRPRTTAS